MFYKIVNNQAPSYLCELLPRTVQERNPYGVRGGQNITTMLCRTETFAKYFSPSTIILWNNLEQAVKDSLNLESFKRALGRNDTSTPKWYYHGKRDLQIIHSQIRCNCSPLKYDLFQNHVTDDPHCLCGNNRETAEHFFPSMAPIL
jgi:hypothetical protein